MTIEGGQMPGSRKLISIVTPFYNEAGGIEAFHARLTDALARIPEIDVEIIAVDDGSQDQTLAQLLDLVARDGRVRVIELSRNFGKEAALTAGIDAASGDAVIPFDADLQDPPEVIGRMIEAWRDGAEVVLARRTDRQTDSLAKRQSAGWFYRVHNRLSPLALPENVGDFRLMDRVVVEALKSMPERQRFMKGLFAWVGFRTAMIDYVREARAAGTSKFTGWRLWNFALEGLTSFTTLPLKIWTYLGAVGALLTSAYGIFIVLRTLINGIEVPGYASLLVAVLFFGSVQLIGIGILGEYIGRIYMETKQRPVYVVRRRYGGSQESTES